MARENDFEINDYVNPDGSLKFGNREPKHTCHGDWDIDECPADHERTAEDIAELSVIYPSVNYWKGGLA